MIVRQWRGLAKKEGVDEYVAHFRDDVLPSLRRLAGFRGAEVLRREVRDGAEITVLTRWESLDAIRAFAGEDIEAAVVAPAARPLFHAFDLRVSHHEAVVGATG